MKTVTCDRCGRVTTNSQYQVSQANIFDKKDIDVCQLCRTEWIEIQQLWLRNKLSWHQNGDE